MSRLVRLSACVAAALAYGLHRLWHYDMDAYGLLLDLPTNTTTMLDFAFNQKSCDAPPLFPTSMSEVATAVTAARAQGRTLKVVGNGNSLSGVAMPHANSTACALLRLDHMKRVLEVDPAAKTVTAEAGIVLHELLRLLNRDFGLSLANTPGWAGQSLGGLVATGSHGTGVDQPSVSSAVLEVTLVDGTGAVRTLSAKRGERDPAHLRLFRAAQASIGALGVVVAVKLQLVGSRCVRRAQAPTSLDAFLGSYEAMLKERPRSLFYFLPVRGVGGSADAAAAQEFFEVQATSDGCLCDELDGSLTQRLRRASSRLESRALVLLLTAVTVWQPGWRDVFFARVLGPLILGASKEELVCSEHAFVTVPLEAPRLSLATVNVPVHVLGEALRAWFALVDTLPYKGEINTPTAVRFVGADEAWLSPSHGHAVASVSVTMFKKPRYFPAYRDTFLAFMRDRFGGRPHFGHAHTAALFPRDAMQGLYPKLDDFAAVRELLDPPPRVFTNDYLDAVLGP